MSAQARRRARSGSTRTAGARRVRPPGRQSRTAWRLWRGWPAVLALGPGALVPAAGAQEAREPPPIPYVDDFVHDGHVGEWRARPIDRVLSATDGTPQALLWTGRVAQGLVVAAEVRYGGGVAGDVHLRVGLAGADSVRLPPIGWGHQFGFEVLEGAEDCEGRELVEDVEGCRAWYERQRAHRSRLPALFARDWRIPLGRPEDLREAGAHPMIVALPAPARASLSGLAPASSPSAKGRPIAGTEGGVGLEILIPWAAFPPVRAPDLEAVRLRVEWLDTAGAGEPGWWPRGVPARRLERPLRHRVTPCDYGIAGVFIERAGGRLRRPASPTARVYMIPDGSADLRELIVLDNEAAGYLYDPLPETFSPAAYRTSYEVLDVGRDERLCTPTLALARGGERISPPDWTATGEGDPFALEVDAGELDVRRAPEGDLLVKSGPRVLWSYYGSGQCGACPRVGLDMFRVSTADGEIRPLLRIHEVAEPGASDVEILVGDDWGTIELYKSATAWDEDPPVVTWSVTRFCRASDPGGAAYENCGEERDVPEPPRRLRSRYDAEPGGP